MKSLGFQYFVGVCRRNHWDKKMRTVCNRCDDITREMAGSEVIRLLLVPSSYVVAEFESRNLNEKKETK